MTRDKQIAADLETSLLHLKTNSVVGSGEKTVIWFYDMDYNYGAGIAIKFYSSSSMTVKYTLTDCRRYYTNFPVILPREREKHWVIEKRGFRIVIYCNGEQVLDMTVSSEACDNPKHKDTWNTLWNRQASNIFFSSSRNSASDSFYIGKTK